MQFWEDFQIPGKKKCSADPGLVYVNNSFDIIGHEMQYCVFKMTIVNAVYLANYL